MTSSHPTPLRQTMENREMHQMQKTEGTLAWGEGACVAPDGVPGHRMSIFFGCVSGRFFMLTMRMPFSILAESVVGSAISGISTLIA